MLRGGISMLEEKRIQIFIDSVNKYFNEVNNIGVKVGSPYLIEGNKPAVYDYTGIIGISGPYRGSVYFSAPRVLLHNLLLTIKEPDKSEETMMDLIGEIANTISGNARAEYGEEFVISTPLVVKGQLDEVYLPKTTRSFVIPMIWKEYTANIVVSIEQRSNP